PSAAPHPAGYGPALPSQYRCLRLQRAGWADGGVLVLVALAQFIVILDTTIVNVALPSIQSSFGLSPENLQWVVTAYTLVFGGFLLPGGRLADLFGRKRWFIIAVVLFGLASLVTSLAVSDGMLIAARAVQGLAGALLTPSALSIVLVSYAEGHRSNVALSAWGIVASAGGAVGALLGGVLTQFLNWRWNFFINVPVTIVVLAIAPKLLPTDERQATDRQLLGEPAARFRPAGHRRGRGIRSDHGRGNLRHPLVADRPGLWPGEHLAAARRFPGAGDPDRRVHVGCDVLRRWRRDKTAVRQHSLLRSTGTSRRSTSPPLSWWSLPSSPRLYSSRRARRASPRKVRPSG
ncbi:MFS transporter, partial [Streptomyces sp. NPDC088178]